MPWLNHQINNFFGFANRSFRYKTMQYTNSCFPCSLHVILRNIIGNPIQEDNSLEDQWNGMHPGGLDLSAPNEVQVHTYLQQTPAFINRINRMKFISPTSFSPPGVPVATLQANLNELFTDRYRAMILGNAHATVIYKANNHLFIHFNPAPIANNCRIERAHAMQLQPVVANDLTIGASFHSQDNNQFMYGGDFILMVG